MDVAEKFKNQRTKFKEISKFNPQNLDWVGLGKPLKRLWCLRPFVTGLKPGANETVPMKWHLPGAIRSVPVLGHRKVRGRMMVGSS
jgi:hypothetical protein